MQQQHLAGASTHEQHRPARTKYAESHRRAVPRELKYRYLGDWSDKEHVRSRTGGIIWHTQGSGRSIVMVLLAKWILENNSDARVAIITDRDELDKQIKGVFEATGEQIHPHAQRPRPDEAAWAGQAAKRVTSIRS